MEPIRIVIDIELPYSIRREDGAFLSACEPLQVFTHGSTREEALRNLREAAQVFIETCLEDGLGALERVLRDAGLDSPVPGRDTFHVVQPYMIPGSGGAASRAQG